MTEPQGALPAPGQSPQAQRGRKRLAALGLDPASHNDHDAVHAFYEAERARYVRLAENGLHMAPSHGLYGMVTEALRDAYGWDDTPDGWSPALVTWPTPQQRANGATGH